MTNQQHLRQYQDISMVLNQNFCDALCQAGHEEDKSRKNLLFHLCAELLEEIETVAYNISDTMRKIHFNE